MVENKNKNNDIGDVANDDIYKNITPEDIESKILDYNMGKPAPISIIMNDDEVIEILDMINSVNGASGLSYINAFGVDGRYLIINESNIKYIKFNITTDANYAEFNKYVNQSKKYRKLMDEKLKVQENMFM